MAITKYSNKYHVIMSYLFVSTVILQHCACVITTANLAKTTGLDEVEETSYERIRVGINNSPSDQPRAQKKYSYWNSIRPKAEQWRLSLASLLFPHIMYGYEKTGMYPRPSLARIPDRNLIPNASKRGFWNKRST